MNLIYHCPLCQRPLNTQGNSLACDANHQFDFAKEGYVNLLPVQNKKSKQPGDNLEMVQARRAFFSTGHYQFLQQTVASKLAELGAKTVLDLGCGEGFYTQAIANQLDETSQVYGLDISKSAVKYAAKRYKSVNFSVASAKQAPFDDASMDAIVTVFAPVFAEEVKRLTKAQGKLLLVNPGPKHLFELKQIIYPEVNLHDAPETPEGFELVGHSLLEQQQEIDNDTLVHLIKMTPFAWKFKDSHLEQIAQQASHTITLSFYISEFTRTH